jgi:hypothetical protein
MASSAERASVATVDSVLERELGSHRERLSVQLRVRIDEVVAAGYRWMPQKLGSIPIRRIISSGRTTTIACSLRSDETSGSTHLSRAIRSAVGLDIELRPAVIQGVIEELAAQETRGIQDPLAKARAIYNYVIATMRTTSPAPAGATAVQYGLAPPSVATARIFTGCLSA